MTSTTSGLIAWCGDLLTRDFCPRFNPLVKWVRNPLAILAVAAVASALCGSFLHPRAFVFALGLAAVMVLGVAWPWLSLRGLRGSLTFDRPRSREGESVAVHLTVRNRLPWGAWGLAIRGAVEAGPDTGQAPGLACADGWRTTEAGWSVVPACRGEYPRTPPRLASAFPFGIRESSKPLDVPSRLLVWPRTFPVGSVPEAASGREGGGLAPRPRSGTAGDPMGVRPYRRGDSLRRIHWPQTARHGHLVVCELHSLALARVQVVLDADPAVHVGLGPDGSLEWAIRVAASFAEDWIGQGADLDLVFGRTAIPSSAAPVRSRQARALDALARLSPDGAPPLADVLDGPACRGFGGGLRVVVTTDLGLCRLARRSSSVERFVVLQAAAFGRPPSEPTPLAIRPWIWVDDPDRVPQQIHRGWKEVAIGR